MRNFDTPGRSLVYATNGMVATSHPLAAQCALDMLRRGGTAMDAALSGAILLGLCEPQMTGLAGDMFALVQRGPGADVEAYNGSGRAPKGASAERLRASGHATVPIDGADAVTIPGAVSALCDLSQSHGRLGLDTLLAPAIRYAEEGIPVAPRVAMDWANSADRLTGHARGWFLNNGAPFRAGEVFRAPGQADVLRRIASEGADGFYRGPVADDILATLRSMGGTHTEDDLASMQGHPSQAISGPAPGGRLFEHPPNGQGATALLMLNILARFDLAAMDPLGAERLHLEAEATKLAYDARNRLIADPDTHDATARMCDPDFAQALADLIDPDRAMAAAAPLTEALHRDTIYITAVDRDGMAVSLIYSIFHGFGTGHATEKYGLILHNRGAGFTLEPGHPNELGPGKRPMHTIIPGLLIEESGGRLPFGVMGGQYQACGHARVLGNIHLFGMDLQTALDAPRAFATEGKLQLESGFSEDVRAALVRKGHDVVAPDGPIGGAQAIRLRADGVLEGASDPRKDGCAIGY